jgi:hypothetical protein
MPALRPLNVVISTLPRGADITNLAASDISQRYVLRSYISLSVLSPLANRPIHNQLAELTKSLIYLPTTDSICKSQPQTTTISHKSNTSHPSEALPPRAGQTARFAAHLRAVSPASRWLVTPGRATRVGPICEPRLTWSMWVMGVDCLIVLGMETERELEYEMGMQLIEAGRRCGITLVNDTSGRLSTGRIGSRFWSGWLLEVERLIGWVVVMRDMMSTSTLEMRLWDGEEMRRWMLPGTWNTRC